MEPMSKRGSTRGQTGSDVAAAEGNVAAVEMLGRVSFFHAVSKGGFTPMMFAVRWKAGPGVVKAC